MGNPVTSLAWLANSLSRDGITLEEGAVVTTGAAALLSPDVVSLGSILKRQIVAERAVFEHLNIQNISKPQFSSNNTRSSRSANGGRNAPSKPYWGGYLSRPVTALYPWNCLRRDIVC